MSREGDKAGTQRANCTGSGLRGKELPLAGYGISGKLFNCSDPQYTPVKKLKVSGPLDVWQVNTNIY